MSTERLIAWFLLFPIVSMNALGQTGIDPFHHDSTRVMPGSQNTVAVGFEKRLGTNEWNVNAQLYQVSGPFSFHLLERFRSTVLKLPRVLIRDEQLLNLRAEHRWSSWASGIIAANNFVVSDDQRLSDPQRPGVTSASTNAFLGGVRAEPFQQLVLEPLVGLRYDNQLGIRDHGLVLAIGAWSPAVDIGGYQAMWGGRMERDYLSPRLLKSDSLTVGIGKKFFERTRDSLQVNYSSNQRDFYFAADTATSAAFAVTQNIERRREDVFSLSNLLEYTVGRAFLLSFQGNISSRSIDRGFRYRPLVLPFSQTLVNTNINELRIGGGVQLAYAPAADLSANVFFHIGERDERHTVEGDDRFPREITARATEEQKKDNLSRRTMLGSAIAYVASRSDTVQFSWSGSLLRYDTPSGANFDDRDELWYSFNLSTLHQINPYLHLTVTAEANLNHLVYLFKEQSASNTWNRVIRLAPRLEFTPSEFLSSSNGFEVLANYTVYDFENDPFVQVKSFSFRQVAFLDSTRLALTGRIAVVGFGYIRLYERGELRWDAFKERPVNYFEDKTLMGWVEYGASDGLRFSVGVRYFTQTRFGYASGSKTFESVLRSLGPLAGLRWRFSDVALVAVDGWYERQTQTGSPGRAFTNISMMLNYYL